MDCGYRLRATEGSAPLHQRFNKRDVLCFYQRPSAQISGKKDLIRVHSRKFAAKSYLALKKAGTSKKVTF
jgi:hypothetical protein